MLTTEVSISPREARNLNFFRLHFSVIRMGSRGSFVLCTATARCTRIAGPDPGGNETTDCAGIARAPADFFVARAVVAPTALGSCCRLIVPRSTYFTVA